jgi:hypothetical protein
MSSHFRHVSLQRVCTVLVLLVAGGGLAFAAAPGSYSAQPLPDPFQHYVVSVTSLQLIDTTGKTVEVMSGSVPIDFSEIIDLDEAVNEGLVPPATYTAATLVLDFSKAQISTLDGNGNVIKLQPYDANGIPLTGTRTVKVRLTGYRKFVVSPKTAALQALDPRLAASNTVYASGGTVTVGDKWEATVVPSGNEWVRLTGGLSAVNSTTTSFMLSVGAKRKAYNTAVTGDIRLMGTPTTNYTIGGRTYVGNAGELILATYLKGTSVTATGSLQPDRKSMLASIIVVN